MKLIKQILKWYAIGIIAITFFLIMFILTERVSNGFDINLNEYHNIPQVIFGFGAFFGLVAFAGFGQPQSKE